MRSSRLRDDRILIAEFEMSRAETSRGATDHVYTSSFIKLILKASRKFDLGSDVASTFLNIKAINC